MELFPGQKAAAAVDQLFWYFPILSRWRINGVPLFMFLFNLLLLIIPWLAVWRLAKLKKIKLKILNFFNYLEIIFWLVVFFLFFPNAAYLMMDMRHLSGFCPPSPFLACAAGVWQLPIFFMMGAVGAVSFVYFLKKLEIILTGWFSKKAVSWLIAAYIPLTALGVMLGMIDRWNSWQAFLAPMKILASAWGYFAIGWRLTDWLLFTAFLYIIYYYGRGLNYKRRK